MLHRNIWSRGFYFNPDTGAATGGANPPVAGAGTEPAAVPTIAERLQGAAGAGQPAGGTPSAPATGVSDNFGGAAGGQGGQQAQGWQSILDAARAYGYTDIPQGTSDHQFLQQLIGQALQARQYQPVVSEYAQNRDRFLAWQASERQKQAEQANQPKPSWWKAPEFDPKWQQLVYLDPNDGQYKAHPGTPYGTLEKFMQARQHQSEFLQKFAFDPVGQIRPGIEEVVREIAGQMLQQQASQWQNTQFSQNFIQQNSAWMHERDQQGNAVIDPMTGQPKFTIWGDKFRQYVHALPQQRQYASDQQLAEDAFLRVKLEYMETLARQGQSQQQAQHVSQDNKAAFLQNAAGQNVGRGTNFLPANPAPGQGANPAFAPETPLLQRLATVASQPGFNKVA